MTHHLHNGLTTEDLIDFEVGSPELRNSLTDNAQSISETLLDSELLTLEETLQSAPNTPMRSRCNSRDSVELDQVLITIDDENGLKLEDLNLNQTGSSYDDQISSDETLTVLNELDRILNAHDDFAESQLTVEECLRDLDEYLEIFDISGSEDGSPDLVAEQRRDKDLKLKVTKLVTRSASLGRNGKLSKEWGTLARNHRFRATISSLRKTLRPNLTDINKNEESNQENCFNENEDEQVNAKNDPINDCTSSCDLYDLNCQNGGLTDEQNGNSQDRVGTTSNDEFVDVFSSRDGSTLDQKEEIISNKLVSNGTDLPNCGNQVEQIKDLEVNLVEVGGNRLRRSLRQKSSTNLSNAPFPRTNYRATICAVSHPYPELATKKFGTLGKSVHFSSEFQFSGDLPASLATSVSSTPRSSGHVFDSDEEIDWSWVQELNACCAPTGTPEAGSCAAPADPSPINTISNESLDSGLTNSLMRSSMRHLGEFAKPEVGPTLTGSTRTGHSRHSSEPKTCWVTNFDQNELSPKPEVPENSQKDLRTSRNSQRSKRHTFSSNGSDFPKPEVLENARNDLRTSSNSHRMKRHTLSSTGSDSSKPEVIGKVLKTSPRVQNSNRNSLTPTGSDFSKPEVVQNASTSDQISPNRHPLVSPSDYENFYKPEVDQVLTGSAQSYSFPATSGFEDSYQPEVAGGFGPEVATGSAQNGWIFTTENEVGGERWKRHTLSATGSGSRGPEVGERRRYSFSTGSDLGHGSDEFVARFTNRDEPEVSSMSSGSEHTELNKNPSEPQIATTSWLRSSMRRITSLSLGNELEAPGKLQEPRPSSSSWLRSSMRRIRHFRLPSDPEPEEVSPPNRPISAPVRLGSEVPEVSVSEEVRAGAPPRSSSESSRSRRARSLSSSESSLASSVDSTPSCTPAANNVSAPTENVPNNTTRRPCDRPTTTNSMPESPSPLGQWPHSLSSMLATLGCTLGLFNVCRFASLSVQFGFNFILQFLILSVLFGIPLLTLQQCLGQQLGAGVVDMWRISPIFQGVGVALLAAQAMLGVYSIVGVSWMFIYFRDSFITKMDQYRWAQNFEYYRDEEGNITYAKSHNTSNLPESVPDYLSGVVLQRHNLVTGSSFGAVKFQVAFNLAVVWMIVFVSLSKGLRSYAKVVYVFSLAPVFGMFVLSAKMLGMAPDAGLFAETSWAEFFLNTKSWLAASQEAFLTWGLLGAAVMQLASHNKHRHLLQRDSSLIIVLTITILLLTAFLANTCIEILHFYGYNYMPNSFERISSYIFLRPTRDPLPPSLATTPVRYMSHSSFVIGERVVRPGMDRSTESGYQVLRFATELVPATLAILGPNQISPFWAVLFYFILILLGIAQQLAIWHCVITGIMAIKAKVLKSWETTITFFSCTFGFILGLPMTTEMGIYVVYFLDYCVGGVWWLVFVYLMQVVAVFMVRGRPYSGDTVVTALFTSASSACALTWLAPLLSFTWNVILPVALMVLCITHFRTGNFRELFVWHHALNLDYWPSWARQLGSLIQLAPILCIPVVALIQSYRYLNNGPPDILDRIQLLYRPPMNSEHLDDTVVQQAAAVGNPATVAAVAIPAEDPPPKYTPPPSYTTATGARLAKLLRNSIRRSVRRIQSVLGEGSLMGTVSRTRSSNLTIPPPDYSTVLVEMNQGSSQNDAQSRTSRELANFQGSTLTAADVASILRSSFRRSTVRTLRRAPIPDHAPSGSLSNQNLVDGVAPLGIDTLFVEIDNENKTTDR